MVMVGALPPAGGRRPRRRPGGPRHADARTSSTVAVGWERADDSSAGAMYGMFAVRVIEREPADDRTGRQQHDAAGSSSSSRSSSSNIRHPMPAGHTPFSFGVAGGGGHTDVVPQGHTPFSWLDPASAGQLGGDGGEAREWAAAAEAAAPQQAAAVVDVAAGRAVLRQEVVGFHTGNPSVQTFHGRVHLYTRRFNKGGHGAEPAVLWQHASEFQLDEHFQLCVLCIPSYLGARRGRCLAAVR
jgi:hypothetical protein